MSASKKKEIRDRNSFYRFLPPQCLNKLFLEEMIQPSEQKDHAASVGLRAAKNYMKVATSSCHGLHMPSHVFMRFGSWKESLQSNYLSIKVNL